MGVLAGTLPQKAFTLLSILTYLLCIITGIIGIVKVDDTINDSNLDIIQTCSKWKDKVGRDISCVDNLNFLFAVSIIAALLSAFALVGLLAEIGIDFFRNQAKFLFVYAGRGVYVAVCGTMALGVAGDLGLSTGIIAIILGAFELLYGILVHRSLIGTA